MFLRPQNPARRPLKWMAALSALALAAAAPMPAQAGDQVFRVDLNKTQILRLPVEAASIVVGNPRIADISVHSADMVFVVGRGYGETNLVILDKAGNTVMDADIQVTAVTPSHGVRVFRAEQRQSYSCAPYCQPSPILGDNPGFIGANSGATGQVRGRSTVFQDDPALQALEGANAGLEGFGGEENDGDIAPDF